MTSMKQLTKIWLILLVMIVFYSQAIASDYHVLTINPKADNPRVAFHIPVPNELNSAGINFRVAVKTDIGQTSIVPWLEADFPTEYIAIQNGEIYERIETVQVNANASDLAKRTAIDARFTTLSVGVPNYIRTIYKFWGMNRDVP
jgi:hypothetical protein